MSPQEATIAVARFSAVYPWGESTRRREILCRLLLKQWYSISTPPGAAFVALLDKGYAPTTVLWLALTASRLFPSLKATLKWRALIMWLQIQAARHTPVKQFQQRRRKWRHSCIIEEDKDEIPVDFACVQGSSDTSKVICFVNGRRVIETRRCVCHLPLATIVPPLFDFEALRKMFEELPPDDDTRFVASLFDTDIVASFLLEHPSFLTCTAARTMTREKVIAEALPMLVNQGTFLPIGEKCRALCIPAFLVPKQNQISSRLILDCRVVNEMLTQFPMPAMPLPSIDEVIDAALKFHFMATRDAASMFYQFRLPPSLSALLQLRVANVRGPFSRVNVGVLPMGLSLAPSASQHFTNYICQVVEHRLQQQGREGFKVMAWVDNFLVFATTSRGRSCITVN